MDQYAVITGASAGFGEACARLFASKGIHLILIARRMDRLENLKTELSHFQIKIESYACDVRDEVAVKELISKIPETTKNCIHFLINNAGLAVGRGPIDKGLADDWNRMIDTNIKGFLYISQAFIPFLKLQKHAHIVNLGSIAGKEVYAGGNVYCATKHAVDALSRAMRIDLLPFGIKVTNIAPGAAETEFSIVRFKGDKRTADAVYDGFDPLLAEDIAETIWFVLSRPSHVTINDLTIMPTAQANAITFWRKEGLE